MRRVAGLFLAIGLAGWSASVCASPSPAGDPMPPQSPNSTIAYREWDDLVRKALDREAAFATEIGKIDTCGTNAPHDVPEAMQWLTRGVAAAQLRLGDIARFGELDQPRNDRIALRWYRLASDHGEAIAEEKIGDLYWQGSADLPRDRAEAVRHYNVAASRGIASAERKLAIAYANGDGAQADDAQMLRWDRKAAEGGDAVAAGLLGYAIMLGLDGTYDLVEAATWLAVAAEDARPGEWQVRAAAYLQDAKSKLTPSEREAFRARLARWRAARVGE